MQQLDRPSLRVLLKPSHPETTAGTLGARATSETRDRSQSEKVLPDHQETRAQDSQTVQRPTSELFGAAAADPGSILGPTSSDQSQRLQARRGRHGRVDRRDPVGGVDGEAR